MTRRDCFAHTILRQCNNDACDQLTSFRDTAPVLTGNPFSDRQTQSDIQKRSSSDAKLAKGSSRSAASSWIAHQACLIECEEILGPVLAAFRWFKGFRGYAPVCNEIAHRIVTVAVRKTALVVPDRRFEMGFSKRYFYAGLHPSMAGRADRRLIRLKSFNYCTA